MRLFLLCLAFMSATATPTTAEEPAPGRITGMGGIFFKSEDPAALAAWYSDVLGINVESWGGAILPADAPGYHVLDHVLGAGVRERSCRWPADADRHRVSILQEQFRVASLAHARRRPGQANVPRFQCKHP